MLLRHCLPPTSLNREGARDGLAQLASCFARSDVGIQIAEVVVAHFADHV